MREFLQTINEYPWTSFFVGIFIIIVLDIIGEYFNPTKQP